MGLFSIPWWWYLPLAMLALGGLALLWFALGRDRSRGRRRCPECWYDLSGLPPGAAPPYVCAECGRRIASERDLHRTRRRWRLAVVALLLIAPLPGLFGYRDARRVWYWLPPEWWTVETLRSGETVARRYKKRDPNDWGSRVVVTSRGKVVLEVQDFGIEFGHAQWDPIKGGIGARIGRNEDLNGDGINELIVECYSGGAHCCYEVYVIELGETPAIAATINAVNGLGMRVIGGETLFNISDQSFDYWKTSHAGSPFPSVYYRLKDHRLEIALDVMLGGQAAISSVKLAADAAAVREFMVWEYARAIARPEADRTPSEAPESVLNSTMWSNMLDLLYRGEEERAWRHLDACWPETVPGKEAFKREFLGVLERSVQWRDFQAARAAVERGERIPAAKAGQARPENMEETP